MKRVAVLYANPMGYLLRCLEALVQEHDVQVLLVHWKLWDQTPVDLRSDARIRRVEKDDAGRWQAEVRQFAPHVVITSGWMDEDYLRLLRELRRSTRPVTVCGFDAQWTGSLRQRLGRFWFRARLLPLFDYAWIPAAGLYQFELASRLGFPNNRVLTGVLSGDQPAFHAAYQRARQAKAQRYPHTFFYVGRFSPEKGTVELYRAFQSLVRRGRARDWRLVLVGQGPTSSDMPPTEGIEIRPFMQSRDLPSIVGEVGCLVLPSRRDAWGVVVHEFAAGGVPLLVTEVAGAVPGLVKPGYSGLTFDPQAPEGLERGLEEIAQMPDEALLALGDHAAALSFQVTPSLWAATVARLVPEDAA